MRRSLVKRLSNWERASVEVLPDPNYERTGNEGLLLIFTSKLGIVSSRKQLQGNIGKFGQLKFSTKEIP